MSISWKSEEEVYGINYIAEIKIDNSILEVRIFYDKIAQIYVLKLLKLKNIDDRIISISSYLLPRFKFNIDYDYRENVLYITPGIDKINFSSFNEVESYIKNLVNVINQIINYSKDYRSSKELIEIFVHKGWFVDYDLNKINLTRRSFRDEDTLIITECDTSKIDELHKMIIKILIFSKDRNKIQCILNRLLNLGFSITFENFELGCIEFLKEVFTIGILEKLIDDIEKLIHELRSICK